MLYMKFEAKSDYFVDKLRAIDPNPNRGFALWKCTRSFKRQPMRRFSMLRRDGTWARSDLDIAEEFANDLCERFTPFDLATDEEVLVTTTFSGVNLGPIAHISPISAPEVVEQVKRLKPNKAPGHDGLDGKTIKALPDEAIAALTNIFNAMLQFSHFPPLWKEALIVMVAKTSLRIYIKVG
ncbi:hypothetical protein ACLKA6_008120 [Drosophila palustris]